MDYDAKTDMTYLTDKEDLYHFYLDNGIESVLMIAEIYSVSYSY